MFSYVSGMLEGLVAAQTVHLVAEKHRHCDIPEGDVTIRFNDDTIPATVLATPLYEKPNILNVEPKLVIVTMPPVTIIHNDGSTRDMCSDHIKNWPMGVPVEIISWSRWKALAKQMPIWPLTGLVCLSMLQSTSVSKIVLHGFDFYQNNLDGMELHNGLYVGKMHDIVASIDWLMSVISKDSRITLTNQPNLALIKRRWIERQAFSHVEYRQIEVVDHNPSLNHVLYAASYCCNDLFRRTL